MSDRLQNIACIIGFSVIVIGAPGNWKWACLAVASCYLVNIKKPRP